MIYIKIDDNTFYDDAIVLVRSFYPRTEVTAYKESDSSSDNQKDKLKNNLKDNSKNDSKDMSDDMVIEIMVPDVTGVN